MPAVTLEVVGAKSDSPMEVEAFAELRSRYPQVVVDVGTGDGRGAYGLARRWPHTLVVGTDTAVDNARETAKRAARKPARGGLDNLLLVRAAADDPPAELAGIADEVQVVLPWGALLLDVVQARRPGLDGLAALGREGATYRLVVNAEIWRENTPDQYVDLPEATPERLLSLAARYAAAGLRLDAARYLDGDELATLGSSWARRLLATRSSARFLLVEATRVGTGPGSA